MVERASNYHMTFKAIPPSGLLGNMAPFLNTDVTNPRELYSMLSESRHRKTLLASLNVNQAKLPPLNKLQSSSEVDFRPLKEQAKFSSYPDLVSFHNKHGRAESSLDAMRRSTSLQDVNHADAMDGLFNAKKLKPILRGSETSRTEPHSHNNNNNNNNNEKGGGVKFGQREVRLIKDAPLPPIEGGAGNNSLQPPANAASTGSANHSPQPSSHKGRHHGPEHHPEIFPRGQPVKVEKPVTPTYEDYPEAYWELRSPTVGEPSDLKEDMIDRDRYRLQQISALRLRAMNRELAANRLDSYRRWQQQIHEHSQALQGPGTTSTSSMAKQRAYNGPFASPRSVAAGQQPRVPLPIRNHTLAVSAKSISPNVNPATLKRSKSHNAKTADDPEANDDGGTTTVVVVDVDDARRRERMTLAAKAAGDKGVGDQEGVKPVKASVVNLCMDSECAYSTVSDVYMGVRKITFGVRPQSDKIRTQFYGQGQSSQSQRQGQGLNTAQINGPTGSASATSRHATLGSSHSQRMPGQPRVPSAPNQSMVGSLDGEHAQNNGDTHELERLYHGSPGSKLLLKKFNRLQVFGEKSPAIFNENLGLDSPSPFDLVPAKAAVEKHPYLPKNRPQTYKLDMRHYPAHRHGSAGKDLTESAARGVVDGSGYPLLAGSSERGGGGPAEKSEAATSLSFRFRNGEVIVSRQGKKPNLT